MKKVWKKEFWEKNVGKINYKRNIFITKIYSNIDKCHTIFALLAPFDRTGRKTGSNKNVCMTLTHMIQDRQCRALALDASNVAL